MPGKVIVGAQWGDEGKGKVVDWLASRADIVVRFQGGHNAGHTLVVGNQTYKLSLLPSGLVRGKIGIIGNGVVVDPWALLDEIERIRAQDVEVGPENLLLAENAALILPVHGALDRAREAARGEAKIGTTGRGIGPTYADKINRVGIRVQDLYDESILEQKVEAALDIKNQVLTKLYNRRAIAAEQVVEELLGYAEKIKPYVADTVLVLNQALEDDKVVLFEGGQGTLLDIDHGTYPFVTSSSSTIGGVCTGLGVNPKMIQSVLGVVKAYATRVGEGPMPTELLGASGNRLRESGKEFGSVTGRPRRCGWYDAVVVRYAARINGLDSVALTKLDGSARGGVAIAIAVELGLPVKLVGVGEGIDDLRPFDAHDYARALVAG